MGTQHRGILPLVRHRAAQDLSPATIDGHRTWISREEDDPDWDAFLADTPGGHYVQSSMWARMKALNGWRATRVFVARGDRVVAGAQLLTRPLPLVGAIGYVPKGPLLADPDPELPGRVLDVLHRLARASRVRYLAVQPASNGEAFGALLRARGFQPQPRLGTVTATLRVDLSQELDEILGQMKKRTRANIRRAESLGIVVREGEGRDLDTFYRLLVTASKRKAFPVYSREYYAALWRALAPRGHLKLFLAEHSGEAVAAHLAIPFGHTLFSHVSAWSGEHGSRKPNEALEWAVMAWAKANGCSSYDFEGIDPRAARAVLRGEALPDSLAEGADTMVTRYKLGFGGQVTLLPDACDYVYGAPLRWAYRTVLPRIRGWRLIGKARKAVNRLIQPRMSR